MSDIFSLLEECNILLAKKAKELNVKENDLSIEEMVNSIWNTAVKKYKEQPSDLVCEILDFGVYTKMASSICFNLTYSIEAEEIRIRGLSGEFLSFFTTAATAFVSPTETA